MTGKKPFLARFSRVPIGQDLASRSDKCDTKSCPVLRSKETPRPQPTRITAVGGETTDDN